MSMIGLNEDHAVCSANQTHYSMKNYVSFYISCFNLIIKVGTVAITQIAFQNTVKVFIIARSYFRDLPIFNCFACF